MNRRALNLVRERPLRNHQKNLLRKPQPLPKRLLKSKRKRMMIKKEEKMRRKNLRKTKRMLMMMTKAKRKNKKKTKRMNSQKRSQVLKNCVREVPLPAKIILKKSPLQLTS
jgi:hypothetical protein